MNPQELFIDVSSGRFLDGETTVALAKPTIFSDEQKSIELNVLKIKNNKISSITPSSNSRFKLRLGTTSLKLADGVDVSTAPAIPITALATVTTAESKQAKAIGSVLTYSPVTAQLQARVETISPVTAKFSAYVNDPYNPITATLVASIGSYSVNVPPIVASIGSFDSSLLDYWPEKIPSVKPLKITPVMNTPEAATLITTLSAGSVVSIQVVLRGSGYPNGTFDVTFSGGGATAGTVVASASILASGGKIVSANLISGGSGYASAPIVQAFTPSKSIVGFDSQNKTGNFALQKLPISWFLTPVTSGLKIDLDFTTPSQSLVTVPVSVPSGFIRHSGSNSYEVVLVDGGYGYSSEPSITHEPATDSSGKLLSYGGIGGFEPGQISLDNPITGNATFLINSKGQKVISGTSADVGYLVNRWEPNLNYGFKELFLIKAEWGATVVGNTNSQRKAFIDALRKSYGLTFFAAVKLSNNSPQKYALAKISFAKEDSSFKIRALVNSKDAQTLLERRGNPSAVGLGSDLSNSTKYEEVNGGGFLNTTIEIIDYGNNYSQEGYIGFDFVSSLIQGTSLIDSKSADLLNTITIPTDSSVFRNTILSRVATITTAPSQNGISIVINDGGFGYIKNVSIPLPSYSVSGGLKSISITNQDSIQKAYSFGQKSLSIQSPPSGGLQAQAVLNFNQAYTEKGQLIPNQVNCFVSITCAGSGYTSVPVISSITPDGETTWGKVTIVKEGGASGYEIGKSYFLGFDPPPSVTAFSGPITGGIAGVPIYSFEVARDGSVIEGLTQKSSGFGYLTAPKIYVPSPDAQSGKIIGIDILNKPVGYNIGEVYPISIPESATTGGTAIANFTRINESSYIVEISKAGYGYTSSIVVTAASPNGDQGIISSVSATTIGQGYAPSIYECVVDSAPSGGITAECEFDVSEYGKAEFRVIKSGKGYVTAPNVSVVTPFGNIITGATITCQGSFYNSSSATFSIVDSSGSGAEFYSPVFQLGKILGANIKVGGSGYSNNPKIVFASPTAPEEPAIPQNQITQIFDITTASAGAILGTSTQKDIFLEVYESDGTNEQVVVQGIVNLAKRVLE